MFASSSVMWPSKPASMMPAVWWTTRPSRPSELLPSSDATMSDGSVTRSATTASTNSPGWRMNGSSSVTVTSSVRSSIGRFTSMYAYRELRNTRKAFPTRTSMLPGCTMASSNGSIPIRPAATSSRIDRSDSTIRGIVTSALCYFWSQGAVTGNGRPAAEFCTRGSEPMPRTVDLRTEIPGPKSREIIARKERVVADAKSLLAPFVIDHAHGCVITDVDGNTFLDWSGGIGCLNVGHTNAAVSAALHAQVDRFLHTDFTIVPYESYVELAERITARSPI